MWDSFVKNVGVLTAVATLVGSAIAFFVQRADDLDQSALQARTNERESKKVFLDKQAEVYFETVGLVARLAIAETPDEIRESDERRFWELYWGELGMVEGGKVEESMVLFGLSLQAFRGQAFRDGKSNEVCAAQRKYISLMLSQCVRKSLGENWGVEIDVDKIHRCTDLRLGELPNAGMVLDAGRMRPLDKLPSEPRVSSERRSSWACISARQRLPA